LMMISGPSNGRRTGAILLNRLGHEGQLDALPIFIKSLVLGKLTRYLNYDLAISTPQASYFNPFKVDALSASTMNLPCIFLR